jgi:predicted dithiol-disulfide oxidoreductase (DUF899 family)
MAKKRSRKKKPVARKKAARRAKPKARKAAGLTSSVRYPGETPAYRRARDRLIKSEIELRRHIEAVAAERRKLPAGGPLKEDYLFDETDGAGNIRKLRFSELFAPGKDTLVLYNFMYGPAMASACPSCTSILDALDGQHAHLSQRVNLAVVAKSPLPRILEHAHARDWRNLRLLSSANNSFNLDYHGEDASGSQWPMLNVFVKRGDAIRHFWSSELFYAPPDKGQDMRHVDFMWPLWNIFDMTPAGRGDFRLKLDYGS